MKPEKSLCGVSAGTYAERRAAGVAAQEVPGDLQHKHSHLQGETSTFPAQSPAMLAAPLHLSRLASHEVTRRLGEFDLYLWMI